MKKIIFIIIAIVFVFNSAFSQLQYKKGQLYISPVVSIGAPAIVNQNNFGYGEMAYGIKLGGQAGILFGYDNYLKSSVRFGVLYSQMGQSYFDNLLGVPHKKDITLNYVQVPVVFKYVFGPTKGYNYSDVNKYIFGGFQVGYLLNADIYWERDGNSIDFWDFISYKDVNTNLEEIKDIGIPSFDIEFFSKIDFAISAGGGLQYFIGRRLMIFGEIVGNIGLKDINAPTWRFRNNKKAYSGSLNLFGGIRLGLIYYP